MSERSEAASVSQPKRSNRIIALVLIGAGMLILLRSNGLFSAEVWSVIWPLALIAVGFDLVTEGQQRRKITVGTLMAALVCIPIVSMAAFFDGERPERRPALQETISFDDINQLRAEIDLTAGNVSIRDKRGSDQEAVVFEHNGMVYLTNKEDQSGILEIKSGVWSENDLDLRFNRDLPLDLRIDIGSGTAGPLDFEDLALKRLEMTVGGNTEIKLPEEGVMDIHITSTTGDVDIEVPDELAARVVVDSSWTNLELDDRFVQQDDAYVSEEYNPNAPNRVTLQISAMAGNIRIR